jgi:phospholipid/cholesterol/gamma-HCH transport system permease protein
MIAPLATLRAIGNYAYFAARAAGAACGALRQPTSLLQQVYAVLIGAVPLGIVAGIALGAVVWMHTHAVLVRTGTVDYLPTVLAAAVR